MEKNNKKYGKLAKNIVRIISITCILCLFIGTVSANNNTTINETLYNETPAWDNETPVLDNVTMPYRYTDQYTQDVEEWYQHYKKLQDNDFVNTLRSNIYTYLIDSSMEWDTKQKLILALMGWDYRLDYYFNEGKRTIDEETGKITWDLGIGNWWSKLFGNGIEEKLLPQTIAEAEALYQIYTENFDQYVQALHDAGDP